MFLELEHDRNRRCGKTGDTLVQNALVLFGAGSQVFVLEDIARMNDFEIVGIMNDTAPDPLTEFPVEVVVGDRDIRAWLSKTSHSLHYAISIGNHHGRARVQRHYYLRDLGLKPAHLQHETAFVSSGCQMGQACQLLAFSFVGARANIGDCVILNSKASVDHECILHDGVHVGPGATLAGRVIVGKNTFIGSGAVVCPDVEIAPNSIIGAGAVVNRSLTVSGTYMGVPARLSPV